MAAYSSLQVAGRYPVSGVGMGGRVSKHERGSFALTAALAINDTIALFSLPPRARVTGGFIKSDDLDSNGSPTITYNVGITGTANLFWAASTAGQAGTVDRNMAATGMDYITTAKTPVFLTVLAGPATAVATGNIVVVIEYMVEEPA
jgi:hypothetical protein